jgi:Putative peptidoglycan binding domain
VLLWPATEAEGFTAVAAFKEVEAFTAALRATVLYRTDHSILGVGFVMIIASPVVIFEERGREMEARSRNQWNLVVQRALAQLGYYHGPVDGVVGQQTVKAIRWFQSIDSVPVTGEIDSATLRALRIG